MNNLSKSQKISRSAAWSLAENFSRQVLAMLVFFITARFVSQEAFGIMAVSYLVIEAFRLVAIESIGTAVIAKENPDERDYNACFVITVTGCILSAGIVYALAGAFAGLVDDASVKKVLPYLCLVLLTLGLSRTHEAWLIRHFQFKVLAIRSTLSIVVGGGVGIYMAVQGYGLFALIVQHVTTSLVAVVLLWSTCDWRPSFKTQLAPVKDLLRRARFIGLSGLVGLGNTQMDVFFSSYYFGAVSAGIYNAAKRIVYALNAIVSTSMDKVALSAFADLRSEGPSRADAFLLAVSVTSCITAPVMAGISALSPELVQILLGDKWGAAAPVLSILMVSSYVMTIAIYSRTIFLVNNRTHWLTMLASAGLVCNIILFLAFARHGLLILASLIVLREMVSVSVALTKVASILKIPVRHVFGAFFSPTLSALLMWVGLWFVRPYVEEWGSILTIGVFIVVGAVAYLLCMAVLDRGKLLQCYRLARVFYTKRQSTK